MHANARTRFSSVLTKNTFTLVPARRRVEDGAGVGSVNAPLTETSTSESITSVVRFANLLSESQGSVKIRL